MKRIHVKKWGAYKKLIGDFMDQDAALKPIKWLIYMEAPSLYGEGSEPKYKATDLNVLISYNVYRTWPINSSTVSGEVDKETLVILVSKKYLLESNLLDVNGYWNIDITRDRFLIDGIIYSSSGDTLSSQASDSDLLFMVILKRLGSEKETDLALLEDEVIPPPEII